MKKYMLCWLSSMIVMGLNAQMTITITDVPREYTPLADTIFLAGDMNSWNPGSTAYQFTKLPNGQYNLVLNGLTPGSNYEFKLTRGTWAKGETTANGGFLPNRSLTFQNGQNLQISVAQWDDMVASTSTSRSGYVFMVDTDFVMPQLNRNRRIWIYLPQEYFNTNNNYPVVYMQDGQNLFDTRYAFSGEWSIDESMLDIENDGLTKAIVVGIDNGGGSRIDEYSPWVNSQYGGGEGDEYMDFMVNTLKPYIDANYRTLPDRLNTAIIGSSMGGLISYYGALRFQNIYSKAGIFSPSFWFASASMNYSSSTGHDAPMRFYFVAGTTESSTMIGNIQGARQTMLMNGFSAAELNVQTRTDGQHAEWFWAREFRPAYEWLFNQTSTTVEVMENAPEIYIHLENKHLALITPGQLVKNLSLYNSAGQVVLQQTYTAGGVDLGSLPSGVYYLNVQLDNGTFDTYKLIF